MLWIVQVTCQRMFNAVTVESVQQALSQLLRWRDVKWMTSKALKKDNQAKVFKYIKQKYLLVYHSKTKTQAYLEF